LISPPSAENCITPEIKKRPAYRRSAFSIGVIGLKSKQSPLRLLSKRQQKKSEGSFPALLKEIYLFDLYVMKQSKPMNQGK
jgi:hypothetical protein